MVEKGGEKNVELLGGRVSLKNKYMQAAARDVRGALLQIPVTKKLNICN